MNRTRSSTKSLWFIGALCLILAALIGYILVGVFANQNALFNSSSFRKAMTQLFNKPAGQITQEDLNKVEVVMIDDTNGSVYFGFKELFDTIDKNAKLEDESKAEDYSKHITTVSLFTYRLATAYEALFGFHALRQEPQRNRQLLALGYPEAFPEEEM